MQCGDIDCTFLPDSCSVVRFGYVHAAKTMLVVKNDKPVLGNKSGALSVTEEFTVCWMSAALLWSFGSITVSK